jgi:hypothetical protein
LKHQQPQGTSKLLLRLLKTPPQQYTPSQPGRWTGPASYAFSHLRKRAGVAAAVAGSSAESEPSGGAAHGGGRRSAPRSELLSLRLDIWPNSPMPTLRVRRLSMIISYWFYRDKFRTLTSLISGTPWCHRDLGPLLAEDRDSFMRNLQRIRRVDLVCQRRTCAVQTVPSRPASTLLRWGTRSGFESFSRVQTMPHFSLRRWFIVASTAPPLLPYGHVSC